MTLNLYFNSHGRLKDTTLSDTIFGIFSYLLHWCLSFYQERKPVLTTADSWQTLETSLTPAVWFCNSQNCFCPVWIIHMVIYIWKQFIGFYNNIQIGFVCGYVCECTHAITLCVCGGGKSEENLRELVLSFQLRILGLKLSLQGLLMNVSKC